MLSSEEKGAAFAAYYNGKLVVNLWGGYADIEAWQPWKESTLANTFSLYNMVVTLCLGLLAERYVTKEFFSVSFHRFIDLFLLHFNLDRQKVPGIWHSLFISLQRSVGL